MGHVDQWQVQGGTQTSKIEGKFEFQEYNDIPPADGSLEDVDRPKRNTLKRAYEDNRNLPFTSILMDCRNNPRCLIFCKTLDGRIRKPLEFYATSGERSNDGQTVKNRIAKIFETVKTQFPQIFEAVMD